MSAPAPARKTRTAEEMAKGQREISVAEFFAKNRHLLGFDNPKKALLTTIKEAVDNALDACEEAGILPDVDVTIARVGPRPVVAPTAEGAKPDPSSLNKPEKFRVIVRDNGPGIVREQIPKIFGKLLYGSKFHRLKQSLAAEEPVLVRRAGRVERLPIGRLCDEILGGTGEASRNVTELGIEAPAFDPETLRYEWRPVSDVIRHRRGNEILRVRTEKGLEVGVTGCHSLFTWDPEVGAPVAVEARDLRPGDYLLIPRRLPSPRARRAINILETLTPEKWGKRRGFVYGVAPALRDLARRAERVHYRPSWSKTPRAFLRFRAPSGATIDVFEDSFRVWRRKGFLPVSVVLHLGLAASCARGRFRTYHHGRSLETPVTWRLTRERMRMFGLFVAEDLGLSTRVEGRPRNAVRAKVFGGATDLLFSEWFGRGAKAKRIPSFVHEAPERIRQSFLDGLYEGDGHRIRGKNELVLGTVSEPLADDLEVLWRLQGAVAIRHRTAERRGLGRTPSRLHRVSVYGEEIPAFSRFAGASRRRPLLHHAHPVSLFPLAAGYLPPRRTRFAVRPEAVLAVAGLGATESAAGKSWEILTGVEPGHSYAAADLLAIPSTRTTGHTLNRLADLGYLRKTGPRFVALGRVEIIREAYRRLEALAASDLCLVRVEEITRVDEGNPWVYDLSVPGVENFVGGRGLLACHNSRGQQGIGISAAAMYGQMTTGSAIHIVSRTSPKKQAHRFEIHIDTKRNEPAVRRDEKIDWKHPQGTEVEITLEGIYQKGARSVEAYLEETVMANPHVTLRYTNPDGEAAEWARAAKELPVEAVEIKPHPYGVELGRFMEMLKSTSARNVKACLQSDFSRVGPSVAAEILAKAKVSPKTKPLKITHDEAHRIHHAVAETKIIAPPTNCLSPIGEELLLAGLRRLVKADFYTSVSRRPTVYRGNPFMIECAVAFGGELSGEDPAALHRFANRVPLLYQQGGCATFKAGIATNWRAYGLSQPKGGLPTGPLAILIHIASVWVPFTSEAKEAIASYPEIQKEMRLALQECGRRLGITIRKAAREADANKKRDYIRIFLPQVVEALGEILSLSKGEKEKTAKNLTAVLAKTKVGGLTEGKSS